MPPQFKNQAFHRIIPTPQEGQSWQMTDIKKTDDLRIDAIHEVAPPSEVHAKYPITEPAADVVANTRAHIHNILHGEDDRCLVVIGPCSIHDTDAALDYAGKLLKLRDELAEDLEIVMRVYFEKPRTTVGWKGLINDPDLDGSFHINKGLQKARSLLLELNNMGMPAATEFLDLITPQYFADLISWGAIGARTTESQAHRELASGLSCPVGFKNGTDGTLKIAVDAIRAASTPHHFLSLTKAGHSAIFATTGNEDCHIILRGGKSPNFDTNSVSEATADLEEAGLDPVLMIDCSHANSQKQHQKQIEVAADIAKQISEGNRCITGVMIESHLVAGRQDITPYEQLTYGQSITDACINWDDSIPLLKNLAAAVRARRAQQ